MMLQFGLITFDLLMGETETPHFYDIGIWGRVPEPQKQLCLSLETPGYHKNQTHLWNMIKHILCL